MHAGLAWVGKAMADDDERPLYDGFSLGTCLFVCLFVCGCVIIGNCCMDLADSS